MKPPKYASLYDRLVANTEVVGEGRLIPVLFPTAKRLLQEAADAAWDTPGELGACPF